MIAAPRPVGPALGPLPEPREEELQAAFPRLHQEALTLTWAAEVLALPVARLEALARAGELLVVPGPWPMRQAHRAGLGYVVPAWQLDGAGGLRPGIASLIRAAAGRTSLGVHEFMTTPLQPGDATPAQIFAHAGAEPVLALLRADATSAPISAARMQPAPLRRRSRLTLPVRGPRRRQGAAAR